MTRCAPCHDACPCREKVFGDLWKAVTDFIETGKKVQARQIDGMALQIKMNNLIKVIKDSEENLKPRLKVI